jgi:hypothetical protein
MAITNAQQARQLYIKGGQVNPDGGRAKFNMGGKQFTSGDNISPGTDVKGNIRKDNPLNVFDGAPPGMNTAPNPINLKKLEKSLKEQKNRKSIGFQDFVLRRLPLGNTKAKLKFAQKDKGILDYINSLSEEDQKSRALMLALNDPGIEIDGKRYEDFLADDLGLPSLKYSGDIGNLRKVKKDDGTFEFIEGAGDSRGNYYTQFKDNNESILPIVPDEDEDEGEIVNYRLMADGGRASFQGGGRDASKSDFKSPTTTAKAPPSMGFGNPPPGSTGEGGGDRKIIMPGGGVGRDIGKTPLRFKPDNLFSTGVDKKMLEELGLINNENENTLFADVSAADINRLIDPISKKPKYSSLQDVDDIRMFEEAAGFKFNPTMTDQEIRDVLDKKITRPTGQFAAAADGGRIGAQEGGIMDLETGRQQYFLGKLVKKATRAVKKIAKSPIGKAALLYFGGQALSGLGGGQGIMANLFGTAAQGAKAMPGRGPLFKPATDGILGKLKLTKGGGSMGLTAFSKIGIPTALSYFMTPKQEDDDDELYAGADLPNPVEYYLSGKYTPNRRLAAEGGSMDEPVAKKTMPLLDMDGQEMDLRAEGGFVPLGRMEKADDVPARLSKNEFVFTADAVRNAGEGDVDKGAEVMYNMMKNLESGGEVSEESQGLEGAREMFQTSQRLEEVI